MPDIPSPPVQILVVDDDPELRNLISHQLAEYGFTVETAGSAAEGHQRIIEGGLDLILLDLGLGDGDGMDLCRDLRRERTEPIIMLTARDDPIDRIMGIEVGADDYITKPFHTRELVARIRAVLRRTGTSGSAVSGRTVTAYRFAGWHLDLIRRELRRPCGTLIHLSDAEFEFLAVLAARAGRVVTRDEAYQALHGRLPDPEDRSLDLRLSRLRRKVEDDPKQPALIKTVRGGGYLLTEQVETL